MMESYVVGFLHSFDLERWLLIDKGQTLSKAGNKLKWCGLGGRVQHIQGLTWEDPHLAMMREFMEESGHKVTAQRWHCFHIKYYLSAKIYCFQCAASPDELQAVVSRSLRNKLNVEGAVDIHHYVDLCFSPEKYTFDLRYLIPMIILESNKGMMNQLDPEGINSDFKRST